MIIKSHFHDYYDGVQNAFGYDDSLRYIRQKKNIQINIDWKTVDLRKSSYKYNDYSVSTLFIGFCGKVYEIVKMGKYDSYKMKYQENYLYSLEEVQNWVTGNLSPKEIDAFYHTSKKQYLRGYSEDFKTFYRKLKANGPQTSKVFQEHLTPIFTYPHTEDGGRSYFAVINDCLKNYEFYKVFDSYSCFQELSMFMGNLAWPNKPIPKIDDKTLAEAKGFDKWSFRKEPKS